MNYKNPDFYRRSENFFPKRDNSAYLRRALSKKYKEDTPKILMNQENEEITNKESIEENENNIKYNDYSNKSKNIPRENYDKNFFQTYNNKGFLYNNSNKFRNKNKNEKDNNNNSQGLFDRLYNINKSKTKYNLSKNYESNISDDNVYEEFIINYNRGENSINNPRISNTLDRQKPMNKIYSKVTLNNGIYRVDKKFHYKNNFNNNDRVERVEYFSSTYHPNHPYQKRRVLDIKEKEPIENGMPDKIKKELYNKNNRNNYTNYNFFNKK